LKSTKVDGTVVHIGDTIDFKSDIEQYGTLKQISRTPNGIALVLTSTYGFHGDYIGGQRETEVLAKDCWVD